MKAIRQYKIFNKDEDGKLYCQPDTVRFYYEVGKQYKSNKVDICSAGFHTCKRLTDCLKYYPLSKSVVYAEVEIWGKQEEKDNKIASKYLRITKILTFNEVKKILKEENESLIIDSKNIIKSDIINDSYNVEKGDMIDYSFNIDNSNRVIESENISNSNEILKSRLVSYSSLIIRSRLVERSERVKHSFLIDSSDNVDNSKNIMSCDNILNSICIYDSYIIINSKSICNSYFIRKCSALSNCLFCFNIKAKENYLFNKEVSEDRIKEIVNKLYKYLKLYRDSVPVEFNNFQKIQTKYKKNLPLEAVNPTDISFNLNKDFLKYIKSLPEFDDEVWQKIIEK